MMFTGRLWLTWMTSMNPVGNLWSVLTFPSILMRRCFTIALTSFMVKAYFRRFLVKYVATLIFQMQHNFFQKF